MFYKTNGFTPRNVREVFKSGQVNFDFTVFSAVSSPKFLVGVTDENWFRKNYGPVCT